MLCIRLHRSMLILPCFCRSVTAESQSSLNLLNLGHSDVRNLARVARKMLQNDLIVPRMRIAFQFGRLFAGARTSIDAVLSVFRVKSWNLHCESKKQGAAIFAITSPNVDRFSNYFH